MEFLNVLVAAIASFAFGAVWYMTLAKPWMAAAGVSEEQVNSGDKAPYVIGLIMSVIAAGMMRHIFASSGVDSICDGLISGFGLGLFIATPWLATNYAFAMRPKRLILIDGGYATGGSTIMGLVLTLF